jgi:hypothetical protein
VKFQDFWLQYQKNLPRLYQQMKKINIISATSAPSESAFSVAGYIQRRERSRLSSQNLRYSLLTKQADKLNEIEVNF